MTQIVNVHIGLSAWTNQTYTLGARRSNAGNAYQCITAGSSTAAPTGTGASINNGGVAVWKYLSSIDRTSGDLQFSTTTIIPATLTQPVIVYLWNDGLITTTTGVAVLSLGGHTTSSVNTITVMPAPGDGFDVTYRAAPSTALAFNAANGLAIQLPSSGVGGVNYVQLDDNYVIIRGLQIKDPNSTSGSTLIGGPGTHLTVQSCILDGYAQDGGAVIVQFGGPFNTFINNLIIDRGSNFDFLLQAGDAAGGQVVVNNTFVQLTNVAFKKAIDAGDAGTNSCVAKNNIFINTDAPFAASTNPAWATSNNAYTAASFDPSNSGVDNGGSVFGITTAATFVAFSTNFNIKTGSATLNVGATDTTDIPTADDMFGVTRPQGAAWDIGSTELITSFTATLTSETAATSDSLTATKFGLFIPSETAASSDVIKFLAANLTIPPDSISSSDSFTVGVRIITASLTDAITSADALSGVLGTGTPTAYNATLSNSVATSDALTSIAVEQSTLSEVASSSDGIDSLLNAQSIPPDLISSSDSFTVGPRAAAATLADTVATSSLAQVIGGTVLADVIATSDSLSESGSGAGSGFSTGFSSGFGAPASPGGFNSGWSTGFNVNHPALRTGGMAATAAPADTVATSDALTRSGALLGTLTDALTITDILSLSAVLPLTDSVATTDGLSSLAVTTASLSDSVASSDSRTGVTVSSGSLSDSVATSDTMLSSLSTLVADSSASSDSLTGIATATALVAETTAISEALQITAISLLLADSIASSDNVGPLTGYATSLSDTLGTLDSPTAAMAASLALSETTATSEALTANLTSASSYSDSTATSSTVGIVGWGLSLGDSPATSDSVTASGIGLAAVADTAATNDTLGFINSYSAALNETSTTSETLSFLRAFTTSLGDTTATSETLTAVYTIVVQSLADTTATLDALTPATSARTASLSDSFTAADVYNLVTYLATLSESIATSDSLSVIQNAQLLIAETAATTDIYRSLTLIETATTSDITTGQGAGFAAFLETMLSGDIIVTTALGYNTGLTDSAAGSDSAVLQRFGYNQNLADTLAVSDSRTNDGVGASLTIIARVVPTGGAVLLQFPGYFPVPARATQLTISRSIAGSGVWTQIYQGIPVGVFIDVGDGMPKPLDPATAYLWQAMDYSGTTIIGPLTPSPSWINQPDQLTQILIRSLQGALNSMTIPKGIQKPQITIRMPTNGWQAMPFIVVNLDLIQQTEVEIGQGVANPTPDNNWTIFADAKRVWRVTIMSQDAEERDFYRDTLLAVFRVLKATAFSPIGFDVSHSFQANSYSDVDEYASVTPGFYAADLMLEINGIFPAAVLTHYPVIMQIESDPTWLTDTFEIALRDF